METHNTPLLIGRNNPNILNNNYYWKFLIIIGIYYLLPSLQFVIFQTHDTNVTCYYNLKCKKDLGNIPAFNNIISNIFYILFGIIFIIIVKIGEQSNKIEYGLQNDYSLYYSLGLVLFLEGICSGLYHTCPSNLNFQFDTTFMFIGTVLMFLTLYHKRHPDGIPCPMKTYLFLSLVVFINILPLSGVSTGLEAWYWAIIYILTSYLMIFGSIYIYYGKEYDLDIKSLKLICHKIRNLKRPDIPKFLLIIILNTFTLSMLIYGGVIKPNFTLWMLSIFIVNMVIYFVYYLANKIKHNEKISKKIWIWLVIDIIILSLSLYFFELSSTDSTLSPEQSNDLNKDCVLFSYFDYHDIWHILSSTGLFIFMNIVYCLDQHLNSITYEEIVVF